MLSTIALALAFTSMAVETPSAPPEPAVAVEVVLSTPRSSGAFHEFGAAISALNQERIELADDIADVLFRSANPRQRSTVPHVMTPGDTLPIPKVPMSMLHEALATRDVAAELRLDRGGLHVRAAEGGEAVLTASITPRTGEIVALRLPGPPAEPAFLLIKATPLPAMPEVMRMASDYAAFSTYSARWQRPASDFFPPGEVTLAFNREPLRLCIMRREEGRSPSAQVWVYADGVLHHAMQSDISLGSTGPVPIEPNADALRMRTGYVCPDLHLLLGVRPWYPREGDDFSGGGLGSMTINDGLPRELRVVTTRRVRPEQSNSFQFDGEPLRLTGYEHRASSEHAKMPDRVAAWELVEARINEPLPADAFDLRLQRLGLKTVLAAASRPVPHVVSE